MTTPMLLLAQQWPTWLMSTLIIAFVFACVLLVLTVLIQKPQGGGLAGAFGGAAGSGQTAFGTKTGDALTVLTIIVFAIFLVFAIVLNLGVKAAHSVAAPGTAVTAPPGNGAAPTTTPTTPATPEQLPATQPSTQPTTPPTTPPETPTQQPPAPTDQPPAQPAEQPPAQTDPGTQPTTPPQEPAPAPSPSPTTPPR